MSLLKELSLSPKKFKAIQAMCRPSTVPKVRSFISMIWYYRDLWPRRSHILQPYTEVSSGKKGAKPEVDSALHKTKQMVCQQSLLTYPDWNQWEVVIS